ncbi:MAG: DJ-1/PfpI family protein [Oscillospiraceae bacterium]
MVYIMLADGFEEAEAVIPADLLRRAGIETAFLSLEEREVTGARGITITAQLTLAEADTDNMEMLVLPGGLGGVENIQMNLFAMALIQKAFDKGCYLAALCAAPTILAKSGHFRPSGRRLLPRHGGADGLCRGPARCPGGGERTGDYRGGVGERF